MKLEEEIKQKTFLSNNHKASLNLLFTSSWLLNMYEDIVRPYGVTIQQFNVLRILKGQYPGCISATEIKIRMLDKNSDISRIIERLTLKELVSKTQNKYDRRAFDICITQKGIELLDKMTNEQVKLDAINHLSEEEANALSDLLDKFRG